MKIKFQLKLLPYPPINCLEPLKAPFSSCQDEYLKRNCNGTVAEG